MSVWAFYIFSDIYASTRLCESIDNTVATPLLGSNSHNNSGTNSLNTTQLGNSSMNTSSHNSHRHNRNDNNNLLLTPISSPTNSLTGHHLETTSAITTTSTTDIKHRSGKSNNTFQNLRKNLHFLSVVMTTASLAR
jgi:hypothetical protein